MNTNNERKRLYDLQKGICAYCQVDVPFEAFTIDHIKAKSKGGTFAQSNLVGACKSCNRDKGHKGSTSYSAYRFGLITRNQSLSIDEK